jgi:hypothetical protein
MCADYNATMFSAAYRLMNEAAHPVAWWGTSPYMTSIYVST